MAIAVSTSWRNSDRRGPARASQRAQGQRFPYCPSGAGRVLRDRDGEQAESPESGLKAAGRDDDRQTGIPARTRKQGRHRRSLARAGRSEGAAACEIASARFPQT
jgi:hypothetical protein